MQQTVTLRSVEEWFNQIELGNKTTQGRLMMATLKKKMILFNLFEKTKVLSAKFRWYKYNGETFRVFHRR